jgi:hypothetical protein
MPACKSVPQTHSHNDYEHTYPLFDAMSWGFISVESDIWLYPNDNGKLRVAHDEVQDPAPLPTIQDLYLNPLAEQYEHWHNGGVYRDGSTVTLLIDIKSTGLETYQRLDQVLAEYNTQYPGLFTVYTKNPAGGFNVTKGAVTAIISGNRELGYMESQNVRYAGYDGRQSDIGGNASPGLIPLISDNWDTYFSSYGWEGRGPMPSDIRAKMHEIIGKVHGEGKIARFWNLPNDGPNVWGPLYEENIDLINTDDLPGLSIYIQQRENPCLCRGQGEAR